jgi:hypothetical protein
MAKEVEKKKGKFGIIVTIFFTGFVSGIFSGLAANKGFNLNLDSILTKTLGGFCDILKKLFSDTSSSECGINFKWVAIALGVLGVIEILITAAKLKNWFLGLIIFGIGYGVGFIFTFII